MEEKKGRIKAYCPMECKETIFVEAYDGKKWVCTTCPYTASNKEIQDLKMEYEEPEGIKGMTFNEMLEYYEEKNKEKNSQN